MALPVASSIDYEALVRDDRVHASLYTDPRIFDDEMERAGECRAEPLLNLTFLI